MIYLKIYGRIGNQLFMYAAAKMAQKLSGRNQEIVIEDYCNRSYEPGDPDNLMYQNSLIHYPLENTRFVNSNSEFRTFRMLKQRICLRQIIKTEDGMSPREAYNFERTHQKLFSRFGVIRQQNGYVDLPRHYGRDTYISGYFQSEKFFEPIKDEIINLYSLKDDVDKSGYPNLDDIRGRNTVCISAKVQHNVGNPVYNVCNDGYYKRAIDYITERIENPLFFICSDNVEYVRDNLIDSSKYDTVFQDSGFPVHISLAVMAQCKHFIIGNTSYGWWAQYLSRNEDKIVVAPSRWYGVDIPCDIYQDNWQLIEV